jgi:hypothetical protein
MGVFFAIDSFADYRVEYTVVVGGEKTVFATDITVVDTTAPTIETKNLPETLDFGSTFVLDESIIEVTDNSRETVTADFVVTQINGSREIVLQANDAGEYTLQEGYVESLVVSVSATDSHNNTVQEAFTIKNTEGVPVALTKKGNWNTFWSSVADVDYYYAQETVNGTESDVLTVNANVSSIPNAKALALVVKLDTELKNLPGTLEFDIYTENMCNWFSVMPYNGAQKGTEVGFKDYGNDAWYHCKVELVNTIPALDSVILHIQPTTTQWWGEKLNVYDAGKLTTLK